ncbi:8-oxo-dGTP diphosphatase [Sutcliffiella deserti]|uniref:8-oxo-dGTP diphosphatase n=1 Tax=Sutcliffiella deserti TaxID=2875501 RepID=UPI001CBB9314|nr:8-oxo-dGTP diphosphatase [Sutcliffiella deserti]
MTADIKVDIYTMCLVQDNDKVLLINRPAERGFPGYIGPGGKVEFPESLTESAAREVLEETGLSVKNLIYKGLDEFVDAKKKYRYMIFNYISDTYEGELLQEPPEGELHWISIKEADNLPMQPWFKERFPLFFKEGTFEIYSVWDEEKGETIKKTVKDL